MEKFPLGGGLTGLEAHVSANRTAIHKLDEDVESAKVPRQYFDVMRRMHPLHRATRHLAEVLQATRVAQRLNRLAAFFFPLATLVAVFGMNPPETVLHSTSFWTVLAAGMMLGFFVYAVVTSQRGK